MILADDLSGAADSAVAFAQRGMRTQVAFAALDGVDTEVLAVDLDTRRLQADEAMATVRYGWRWATSCRPLYLFKKVDSKLRGHAIQELLALAGDVDPKTLFIVCPAHPATGVVYRDGRPWHHDAPAPSRGPATDYRALARAWEAANFGWVTATATGADAASATFGRRGGSDAAYIAAPTLMLVDAEHEHELDTLVRSATQICRPVILVGSGGLASALARQFPEGAPRPMPARPRPIRAMVVAGSNTELTRRQLAHLATAGLGDVRWVDPVDLLREDASGCLADNGHRDSAHLAAVALGGVDDIRPAESALLVERFASACASLAGGANALVLTGGETARHLLGCLGVKSLQIRCELAPGVVLSSASGGWRGWVVTKSGSFGDVAALTRALAYLRNNEELHEHFG